MRRKHRPAFVMHDGDRSYRAQNGDWWFVKHPYKPWRYRSTINESPLWGIRSGTAFTGVGPGAGRFVNRWKWRTSRGRLLSLLWTRENERRFYAGRYSRWD